MKNTLIVNLYGGPGTGKSTGAAYIFAKLKMDGIDAEYVTEFAKDKVWEGSQEAFKCQFYITGKQAFRISRCYGKVDVIITDSPIMLGQIYAERNSQPMLGKACAEEAARYSGHTEDIFLTRVKPYNPNGRNQTEDESIQIDADIKKMLDSNNIRYTVCTGDETGYDAVVNLVKRRIVSETEKVPNHIVLGSTGPDKEATYETYWKMVIAELVDCLDGCSNEADVLNLIGDLADGVWHCWSDGDSVEIAVDYILDGLQGILDGLQGE